MVDHEHGTDWTQEFEINSSFYERFNFERCSRQAPSVPVIKKTKKKKKIKNIGTF